MHLYAFEYLVKFLLGLLLYNIWMNDKITKNLVTHLLISFIAGFIVTLINKYWGVSTGITIFAVVATETIIMVKRYKRDQVETFSKLTLIYMALLAVQITLERFIAIVSVYIHNTHIVMTIIFLIVILVSIVSKKQLEKHRAQLETKIIKNTVLNVILVNVFLFFNVIVVSISAKAENLDVLPQIIILCILIIAMNIIYLINTNSKLKYVDDIQKIDNMKILLEESVSEMKSKEHEYKNHLNVLYCIMQVEDEKNLRKKAREYIGNVYEAEKPADGIYHIENTILKAILFNTMYKSKIYNIAFTYNVEGNINNISLDDPEFTVLLSNLLNNAVEESRGSDEKFVEIDIYEENGKCVIYVKNSIRNIDKELAQKLLSGAKKSTKGEGRGYGLKNVLNILKRCNGEISIEVVENFIEFIVEIPVKNIQI